MLKTMSMLGPSRNSVIKIGNTSASILCFLTRRRARRELLPSKIARQLPPQNMMIDTKLLVTCNFCSRTMHLPIYATLPNGNQAVIDTMTDSQITDMYELITTAAKCGDGFGIDEYPTEKHFRSEIKDGHHFVVCNKNCGKMVAAISLINSKFYRGQDLTVADVIVIVRKSERGKGIGEFIFKLAVLLSKRLGYLGIYADTFSNNSAMVKIIERTPGFQQICHLPVGGKMPDGTFVGTNVYFKDLKNCNEECSLWISGE